MLEGNSGSTWRPVLTGMVSSWDDCSTQPLLGKSIVRGTELRANTLARRSTKIALPLVVPASSAIMNLMKQRGENAMPRSYFRGSTCWGGSRLILPLTFHWLISGSLHGYYAATFALY
jgi:hypothetical protein